MIKELLSSGRLTLTMYTPETLYSRLTGHVDTLIYKKANLVPINRFWYNFQPNSLSQFYATSSISHDYTIWQTVEQLFSFGPTLVTLWSGEDAIKSMLTIKGATHPAIAADDSIRGRFFCDSPLCNLMHSSDCEKELLRELAVLNRTYLLDADVRYIPVLLPDENIRESICHSGIISFYNVIVRYLNSVNGGIFEKIKPTTDKAKDCNRQYVNALNKLIDESMDLDIETLIRMFISGDSEAFFNSASFLPINKWELLMIRSGLSSRQKWNLTLNT